MRPHGSLAATLIAVIACSTESHHQTPRVEQLGPKTSQLLLDINLATTFLVAERECYPVNQTQRTPTLLRTDVKDAWGRPIRIAQNRPLLQLLSAGDDGEFGTKDDLEQRFEIDDAVWENGACPDAVDGSSINYKAENYSSWEPPLRTGPGLGYIREREQD